jgi:hypothetical protein
MKKVLVVAAAIALVIWVVSWFRNEDAVTASAAKSWPAGLGTFDDAAKRLTARKANDASARLAALADALPKDQTIEEFVTREISRAELTIGTPPALPDVSSMRELLLHEPLVWERSAGTIEVGDAKTSAMRGVQMTSARALVASALAKAHAQDPAAWDDLRAAWQLARSLDGQPHMMTQTAAFSIVRMINAVAWKMPLPAPAWLGELQSRDNLRPLLEAFQYQCAAYAEDGVSLFPTKMLADSVDHDRAIAEELAHEQRCDVNARMNELGTDLTFIWRRVFRYRAELEATANALRVREGKPIETRSQCSDGAWALDATTLRFNREIATTAPDRPMPLVLRVKL